MKEKEKGMQGGIFLLLGSNLGDRLQQLADAAENIGAFATVLRSSSVYATSAWGNTNQPDFLNQVIEIDTTLSPRQLLFHTLDVEAKMGRRRIEKWGARIIDIDILFHRDAIVDTEDLKVPHPQMQNRKFTLVPMRELAPDLIHPVFRKTIARIDDECTDTLKVTRLPPPHSERSS
jgi:2-amino-4-hydroxy-6-hydroxymethyldihydropteridine diphosphokinase